MFRIFILLYAASTSTSINIDGLESKTCKSSTPFPTYYPDTLRVYGMRYCAYTHQVLLTLTAKNISFEVVNINLQNKPEWFLNLNPQGTVPTVQYNDKIIYNSLVASEWIDNTFEGIRKLIPSDPYEKAKQKMLLDRLSKLTGSLSSWYTDQKNQTLVKGIEDALKLHESLLISDYFSGNETGWVDYMIWPWLERMEMVSVISCGEVQISKELYPNLANYTETMKTRPEIFMLYRPPEEHVKYIQSKLDGKPNPDVGIDN